MNRRPFRSVTVQLVILFVAVLTLFELGVLGYRYLGRSNGLTALEAVRVADHIAVIKTLIDETPAADRAEVLLPLQGSDLYVSWQSAKPPAIEPTSDTKVQLLRRLLLKIVPGLAREDVIVGYDPSGLDAVTLHEERLAELWRRSGPFSEPVDKIVDELAGHPTYLAAVRLDDGTWLNFLAAYVDTVEFWPMRSIALLFLLVIGIVALSIWAIQRLTSPFRIFADAANRLARDVNAAPIPVSGPGEVREAARAFNTMQERLQRFVQDRTKMLAAISHDLRTPITRLRLRAECVEDQSLKDKCMSDLSEMEEMISGVLTFVREDGVSEATTTVDLRAMLQGICDDLQDRGYKIALRSADRVPYHCRRLSMKRCFTNILENAVKYGSCADVTLRRGEDEIRVVVEDCGPGIPDNLQNDVFQPFFRLEESRNRDSGGCGLGLTVARTIARAHGGDITIRNRSPGGLEATITLPEESTSS